MSAEESALGAKGRGAQGLARVGEGLHILVGGWEGKPAPEISDAVLDAAAREIRGYAATAMLEFATTVGRIVLEHVYGGDIAAWHAHGRKDVSLRRLAERLGDAHLSASGLSRCVTIHTILLPLGPVTQWRNLTPSHVAAVRRLPAPEQASLLREAEAHDWSARKLGQIVRPATTPAPVGRPRLPEFVGAIRRLFRDAGPDGALFSELHLARTLSAMTQQEVSDELFRARERLDRLQFELSPKRLGAVPKRKRRSQPRNASVSALKHSGSEPGSRPRED